MDSVGFVASVITLVDVSWKVMGHIQDIKLGGHAREKLLKEVTVLWLVLRGLQTDIDPPPKSPDAKWMQPFLILVDKGGILEQIRQEITSLEAKMRGSSTKIGRAWSTMTWPFEEKQALQIVETIHGLAESATLVLSQSNHRLNREILCNVEKLSSAAEDSEFQTILNWLTPLDFPKKQREILNGIADSYTWVLDDEKFLSWHQGDMPSLWCHGPPGAGKSVLAASIFADVKRAHQNENNVAVLVAFCSFDNEASQTPCTILASLLKQVLRIRGRLPLQIKEEHSKSLGEDGSRPNVDKLEELLCQELREFDSTFIILDGLDEAEKTGGRATILRALHAQGPRAKVLITWRFSEDIRKARMERMKCQVCLSDREPQYWCCTMCKHHVLCEDCRAKALDAKELDEKHQGIRQSRWESIAFRPQDSDIRKYVQWRIELDSGLTEMAESQKKPYGHHRL